MTLVDADGRRRAMTDFESVLLVEAAAGTGKTSLMAGRVAMMLAAGHEPGGIAAITFTELAASQLAGRIRETVDTLLAGEVPAFLKPVIPHGLSGAQRRSLTSAAPRLDELTATTIHGFCQAIIHSHGVRAGLDPGARVVDAIVADTLFLGELSAWFSRRLSVDAAEEDPIVVLAEQIPLQVVDLIRELAVLRRKHPGAEPPSPAINTRPDISFVQAVDDFDRWQLSAGNEKWAGEIAHELRKLTKRFSDIFLSTPKFATLWSLCEPGHSRLFAPKGLLLLAYDEAAQVLGAYRNEEANPEALAHYAVVTSTWNELIGHIASSLVCVLSKSLDLLLESYEDRKRASAVLDFDDLLLHVRKLLREHEEVRQAIGRRYKSILVDEFQDTDRIQNEILFSIAATSDRPERWEDSRLRPCSLFLVGDPKQAIYRFRGADIEAYEFSRQLVSQQPGGAIIEVTANFRSQRIIIEHVNACFQNVFAKASQPRYVALAPTIADGSYSIPCVSRFTVELHNEGRIYAEMFREAEAERVADICERLIGSVTITRADQTRGPLRAGDIALLSPGHTELWRYERALEQRGIAVSSQAGQTLMRRQETQDVLALSRVLADSSDTLAFGALMRGPFVGLTEQELLDITAALPPGTDDHPSFFTVKTDPALVKHLLAKGILADLQNLRRRASISTPSVVLTEAIERLNARVIMAARHRNRNARALANLDALIERARSYGVAGLRAFVRDLQADWLRKARAPEGRIDATEYAVEIVTIHSAKGLEWPVVIPINSTTELYRPGQFVHRQSDNSLHWMLGGVAPPDLAAARVEEDDEDANQRERIWYVACTRARDFLILPHIPQASQNSWFSSIDLRQQSLPELDLSDFAPSEPRAVAVAGNDQSQDVFAVEEQTVQQSSPPLVWRRPSDHDQDRVSDPLDSVVVTDVLVERSEVVGGGALRGVVLHKLLEEFLTAELQINEAAVIPRARELLDQLWFEDDQDGQRPDPSEIASCALRAISLPEIALIKAWLVPEVSIWAAGEGYLLAGRADALAIRDNKVELAVDWKSDINPTLSARRMYAGQLRDYLTATGAASGAIVFATLGEIVWVNATTT